MASIFDFLTGKKEPDLQTMENDYFKSVESIPPSEMTVFRLRQEAEKIGLPNPPAAALEMQKIMKGDVTFKKSLMGLDQPQPSNTVPLDLPLAQSISDLTGGKLNYQQAAPMAAPLGMKNNLPITLQDMASMLPPDYQLPGPVQKQQPALSLFGTGALSELPQQPSQAYVSSDLSSMVAKSFEPQKPPDFGDVRESKAKELYNSSYAKLTSEQAGKVNTAILDSEAEQKINIEKQLQPLRVEVAKQTGSIAAETAVKKEVQMRKLPLDPEERSKYLNPDTLNIPPPGMSKEDAINQGYVSVSPSEKDILYDLPNVKLQIDTISKLVNGLITAPDAWNAVTQGVRLKLGAWSNVNPQAATYSDIKEAYVGVLSRRLGGDRGVLSDQDIVRISNSLPSFTDTAVIKDYKMKFLNNVIGMSIENQKRKITGKAPLFDYTVIEDSLKKLNTKKIPTRIGVDSKTGKQVYQFNDGSLEYAP